MQKMKNKDAERVLKALANKRRLAAIQFIIKKRRASVGEVSEELKISFKATSKHLLLLTAAGILDKEQQSTVMFYFASPTAANVAKDIIKYL